MLCNTSKLVVSDINTRFFYKEHLYKELEAEKGSKNKEFLKGFTHGKFFFYYLIYRKEPQFLQQIQNIIF